MRRFAKPLYYLCLGLTIGYFVACALDAMPGECWASGPTKAYCVD
jgi:hypothetical protein